MKLRATSPLLKWTGEAAISTRHPASHYPIFDMAPLIVGVLHRVSR